MRNNFAKIVAGFASLISAFALSSCSLEGIRRELQSQDIHHVPSYMIEPREQLNYLVEHYWDKVNLKDTAWLSRRTELERQFMDYLLYSTVGERLAKRICFVHLRRCKERC